MTNSNRRHPERKHQSARIIRVTNLGQPVIDVTTYIILHKTVPRNPTTLDDHGYIPRVVETNDPRPAQVNIKPI
jgi:hypothetical protein